MADLTGIGTAVTGVKDILSMFFPDRTEEDKMKMTQALTMWQDLQAAQNLQAQANIESAKQPGIHFRDGAGWICVVGLAVNVLKPLIEWGAVLVGHPIQLPKMDDSVTSTMLYGLLGLGSMHAAPAIVNAVTNRN